MIAVIFEVQLMPGMESEYLRLANDIKCELSSIDGFISIERFSSLEGQGKILSLSYWEDETAVSEWANNRKHDLADTMGRNELFKKSVVHIAKVM